MGSRTAQAPRHEHRNKIPIGTWLGSTLGDNCHKHGMQLPKGGRQVDCPMGVDSCCVVDRWAVPRNIRLLTTASPQKGSNPTATLTCVHRVCIDQAVSQQHTWHCVRTKRTTACQRRGGGTALNRSPEERSRACQHVRIDLGGPSWHKHIACDVMNARNQVTRGWLSAD